MGDQLGLGLVFTLKDEMTTVADKISAKFSSLGNITEDVAKSMKSNLQGIAMGAAIFGAGLGLLAPLGMAVEKSMELNAAISQVAAVSNAGAADVAKFKEQAKLLGEATSFTATQVAEGQKFLAMAGFSVNDTLGAMLPMLNLAAAGKLSLGKAADIASNAMAIFGMTGAEAGVAADILAAGATSSNTSIESLGESLKYYASAISTYKIPMSEAIASIGLLGNAGLQGSVATSALSTAMARLSKPTKEMQKTLDDLNIQPFDKATGDFVGLSKVIGDLTKASQGMTQQEEARMMATIFGAEAMKNGVSLMNATFTDSNGIVLKGAEAMDAYTKKLNNADGASQKMSDTMLDNLAGSFTILISAIDGVLINIGDKLEPYVKVAVDALIGMFAVFNNIAKSPIGDFLIYLTAAIGTLLTVVGAGVMGFHAYQFAMLAIKPAILAFKASLLPTIVAIKASAIAFAPFIAVAAVVGGIIYGLVKAYKEFDSVLEGKSEPAQGLLGVLQKVGGALHLIGEVWRTATSDGFEVSGKLSKALEKIGMGDAIGKIGTWVVRVKAFFGGMQEGAASLWSQLSGVFDALMKAGSSIAKAFQPLFDVLGSLMESFGITGLGGEVVTFATAGRLMFESLVFGIRLVAAAVEVLANYISFGANLFSTWANFGIGAFKSIMFYVDMFRNDLITLPELFSLVGNQIGAKLIEALKNSLSLMSNFGKDVLKALPFGEEIMKLGFFSDGSSRDMSGPTTSMGLGENEVSAMRDSDNSNAMQSAAISSSLFGTKGAAGTPVINVAPASMPDVTITLDGETVGRILKDKASLEDARS